MITILRKIRQHLLGGNAFSKYLLYAIGEIVLVVIGILIALSIGSWKEQRADARKRELLLKTLRSEFASNLKQLDSVLYWDNRVLNHVGKLIAFDPETDFNEKGDSLHYWLQNSLWRWSYDPVNGALNSGISSGDIHLIGNDSLVNLLFSWEYVVADARENEVRCISHVDRSFPLIESHIRMFHLRRTYHEDLRESRFASDFLSLYKDPLFEDFLGERQFNMRDAVHELYLVKAQNELILKKIDAELEKTRV